MKVTIYEPSKVLCIQFGSGLVGSAIDRKLSEISVTLSSVKTNWDNSAETIEQISQIQCGEFESIVIIWSAGKAGFNSSEGQTKKELDFFNSVIRYIKYKFDKQKFYFRFWLMSSAGGLHEGQTHVTDPNKNNTLRPYATLKLEQETSATSIFGINQIVICRISSVYTKVNLSGRLGLISVLVQNGVKDKISTIFGSESTLRDYVLDDDIGQYVVDHLDTPLSGIQYLISGSSISIQFIKISIERIILKKLLIRYAIKDLNSENISFSANLISQGFTPSPFLSNLRILYYTVLNNSSL